MFIQKKSTCKVCALARVHIAVVFSILAVWRLKPEWFAFSNGLDIKDGVVTLIGIILFLLLVVKIRRHRKETRRD
jgi:hypothetical protein